MAGPRAIFLGLALLLLAASGIYWLILTYGTPHLRVEHGQGYCYYFGLNGRELYGMGKDTCPLIKMFPLH